MYDTKVGLGGANLALQWLKLSPRGTIIHIQYCNIIGIMQLLILENSQFMGNQMYIITNRQENSMHSQFLLELVRIFSPILAPSLHVQIAMFLLPNTRHRSH